MRIDGQIKTNIDQLDDWYLLILSIILKTDDGTRVQIAPDNGDYDYEKGRVYFDLFEFEEEYSGDIKAFENSEVENILLYVEYVGKYTDTSKMEFQIENMCIKEEGEIVKLYSDRVEVDIEVDNSLFK